MKFVLNKCFGGYGLSNEAQKMLGVDSAYAYDWDRDDPKLIQVVEELGEKANAHGTSLKVVEVPDNATDYEVTDYDGIESIIYVVDGKIHHV